MPNIADDEKKGAADAPTFDQFCADVAALLGATAASKHYSQNGPDGDNVLYRSVAEMGGGHGHAAGEIVYKARRYLARGDVEDVAKIAAWAFLIWRHHQLDKGA